MMTENKSFIIIQIKDLYFLLTNQKIDWDER